MSLEQESSIEEGPEMIQRRELLRRAAWLLGGTISAPAALAVLQGCSAKQEPGVAVATKFLTTAELGGVIEEEYIGAAVPRARGVRVEGGCGVIDIIDVIGRIGLAKRRDRCHIRLPAYPRAPCSV